MPPSVHSLHQLAQAHVQANRPRQAADALLQIVQLYPREPKAPFMLGVLAHQAGQADLGIDWLNKSIAIDSSVPESYFVRGMILQQRQRLTEAVDDYRRCLARRPGDGKALNNLGRALLDLGNVIEATGILREAVAAAPRNAGAWNNLGEAFRGIGDLQGAIAQYKKAIAVDPNCAEAHGNLGACQTQLGDKAAGILSIRRAIAINPQMFNAHVNLARACMAGGPLDEAEQHCARALQIRPDAAGAIDLMANLLGLAGRVQECVAYRQRAIELKPDDAGIHSNLLMSLHYLDDRSSASILAAHIEWAQKHTPSPTATAPRRNHDQGKQRLRIGYLSPNFNAHSVAYFFEPVLHAHDRAVVEIFCYSNLRLADLMTQRIRASADFWREILGKSDAEAVAMIEHDQIDILIDLAGHTSDNRLLVFARRAAPIQMTWLGYPATTGLRTIDYRLTDAITDPPGVSDALHTEKLVRIPGGCWAYQAPVSPPIAPFPALANGLVTFGSFNNLPKVTPRVLETWAEIMRAVPNSRLLLKAAGLGSKMGREYIQTHLARFGIEPGRLELVNWKLTTAAHLQLYDRVDIALDTFPYNGTTTTCEALWMGVPVVTFAGSTHVSRVGAALLTHAGCREWVADDVEGYVKLAVHLAGDLKNQVEVRRTLRDRMQRSALGDAGRLAREMERIFREAWSTLQTAPNGR